MTSACTVQVRGVVQGVGFRPFVFRLARAHALAGWVRNGDDGVEIRVEGEAEALRTFVNELARLFPPAAHIASVDVHGDEPSGLLNFTIQDSRTASRPTARISPDLAVCTDCLAELFDPNDRRFHYPYINCTNCGPRYSIIESLPYDRARTTMAPWALDAWCAGEYNDPANRRFHAEPVACPSCGPAYRLLEGGVVEPVADAIAHAARLLASGSIVAVKGLGGYHLACDATNREAVAALRDRKFRKEKPFALMARDAEVAGRLVRMSDYELELLQSPARPIVLAPALVELPGVAPDCDELGVMLPYTPVHHLLFASNAPPVLVMTSGNRSNEPIACGDGDALTRLRGIADAFLVGQRQIARRMDDSVVRADAPGPTVLRRARGYAPAAVASIPSERPILAVGADLKNAITLVVDGQAFAGQYIGDLDLESCRRAFSETVNDLLDMYAVDITDAVVAHDSHPQYVSTQLATELPAARHVAVQHHRAHVLSVLAERGAWDSRVLGVAFDGTGFGDDGTIWGGEIFAGSARSGFERVGHLRSALLPGGDAAARWPVQAAAGFLAQIGDPPDVTRAPFCLGERFVQASRLVTSGVRSFPTTSMGRLFDSAAALLGFTRGVTFEGQAAMWLEHLANSAGDEELGAYSLPFDQGELDFRPLLRAIAVDRVGGASDASIARAFHRSIARSLVEALGRLSSSHTTDAVIMSGGVFQNRLLLADARTLLEARGIQVWTNHAVPPNDGGVSLGQAAGAAMTVGAV
ncbi:MAG: carbamoyltransferase HypF [Vicinamibacterales bacterium]